VRPNHHKPEKKEANGVNDCSKIRSSLSIRLQTECAMPDAEVNSHEGAVPEECLCCGNADEADSMLHASMMATVAFLVY